MSTENDGGTIELVPLSKAISILRERNPGCYVNRGMLETAIAEGKIGYIPIGSRKIVDIQQVSTYLKGACYERYPESAKKPRRPGR